jgi:hypothetical protein
MTATTASQPLTTRTFALVSGWSGALSGVLFVMLFGLADPFGDRPNGWAWTGAATDAVGVVQMLTLAPVAWNLWARMPASRSLRIAGVAVAALAVGAAVLQILIFVGVVPLADNIVGAAIATYAIFVWILMVSLAGHRTRTLPRPLTRIGLVIGAALPVAVVLLLPALITPEPLRRAFLVAGLAVGVTAYLAIPVFPLLLAKYVFTKESP